MKPIFIAVLAWFAWSLVLTGAPERVAILLRESTHEKLAEPLATYITDVEQHFPVKLHVFAGKWNNPEQVRVAIKDLHEKHQIAGVILVGAMPMHRFYMHHFANPNPLYYEDFDLPFRDRDGDGFADIYEGIPAPKVWVANLRSSVKADDDDIASLRTFLEKTHAYYQAKKHSESGALVISASDWPDGGTQFKNLVGDKLLKKDSIEVLEDKTCVLATVQKALKARDRSLTYIQVHSNWNAQSMEGGDLKAEQVESLKTGSLITINHGCSAGNWMHNEAEKTSPNMAMSYVFGKNIGQVVVAQARTGMIYGHEVLYQELIEGAYFGKAYLKAKQVAELQFIKGDHVPGDIVAGILMIGNPFVQLKASDQ